MIIYELPESGQKLFIFQSGFLNWSKRNENFKTVIAHEGKPEFMSDGSIFGGGLTHQQTEK